MLVSQDEPRVLHYRRDGGRLFPAAVTVIEGLDGTIELPELDLILPLPRLYEDAGFDAPG